MKCPFKKITEISYEYHNDYVRDELLDKPQKLTAKQDFGKCDEVNCFAYDGGICLKLKGGIG